MTYPLTPGSIPGSPTSIAAAVAMSAKAVAQRARVHAYIVKQGKATCFDVEDALGLKNQTASARIRELVMLGQLQATGEHAENVRGNTVTLYEPCERPEDFTRLRGPNRYVGHSCERTRNKIAAALEDGPLNYAEIASITGLLEQTVTPAIADMLLLGTVRDTGRKSRTRHGGNARLIAKT